MRHTHTLIDLDTLRVLLDRTDPANPLLEGAIATAEDLLEAPMIPKVVANISGGLLQGYSYNAQVDLFCLDFDGVDPTCENVVEIDGSSAYCMSINGAFEPEFVGEVEALYEALYDDD